MGMGEVRAMQKAQKAQAAHKSAGDPYDGLAKLLKVLRTHRFRTRPELARDASLGRNIVSADLRIAQDLGLAVPAGTAPSSGGRAPELWRFVGERGAVLVACVGAAAMRLALVQLDGTIVARSHVEWLVSQGPEATLTRVADEFDAFLKTPDRPELWGIAIALPGPVEHQTGRPVDPPIMPGWNAYDVRGWFAERYGVGVWVDNDVNAMALGHLVLDPAAENLIYVKVGTGLGAGLISRGSLHRGSQGAAGDIGHVRVEDRDDVTCRCGRTGCLEAYAAGWAMERDAITAHIEGRSAYLTSVMHENGRITPADIGRGTKLAEPTCVQLTARSATRVGNVLAVLVNFFNPSHVVLGGGVVESGELFLQTVERIIRERAIGLGTETLVVSAGHPDQIEGLLGGARMVVDALLEPALLAEWAPLGSPAGVPAIVNRKIQDELDAA